MKYAILLGIALTTLLAKAADNWWQVFGGVENSDFAGGHYSGEKKPSEELVKFLAQTKFDEWETYEDEFVVLRYPKHKLLKLSVKGGNQGIKVEGGVCTTVDNSYQRAYVLMAGDATYCVYLLNAAEWLDDGICLCGPMVHHVYRHKNGCLERYSLLPGGAVKKAQILGGKVRLMVFEWTHLACQREIYEKLVDGMQLKIKHPDDEKVLREKIMNQYGLDGTSGWLHPGMTLEQAKTLLGEPAKVEGTSVTWNGLTNDYPCELKAIFNDTGMVKIEEEGVRRTGEDAVKGSLSWLSDTLETWEEEKSGANKPTDKEWKEFFSLFAQLTAKKGQQHAQELLYLATQIANEWKQGHECLARVIRDYGRGNEQEWKALVICEENDLRGWMEKSLDKMASQKQSFAAEEAMFGVGDVAWSRASGAHFLLTELTKLDATVAQKKLDALLKGNDPVWSLTAIMIDNGNALKIENEKLAVRTALAFGSTHQSEEIEELALKFIIERAKDWPDRTGLLYLIEDLLYDKSDTERMDAIRKAREAIAGDAKE